MPTSDRIARLIKLLGLLQSGGTHNADDLAEICGVSRRTVFRDLNKLRDCGVPVQMDEDQRGYRLPAEHVTPTSFTRQETLSLLVLCRELGGADSGLPFQEDAALAATKIVNLLPPELRSDLEHVENRISVELAPQNRLAHAASAYRTLLESMRTGRSVWITYRSLMPDEADIAAEVHPYRLHFSRRSWYAIGWSSLHAAVRTFNLSRVRSISFTEHHYEIPPDFDLESYFGDAWNMIPEPHDRHEVVVRFQPMVAHNVAEIRWHRTQRCQWNADGTLDYHVTVDGLREIAWWILGYGEQAEVLRPQRLRDDVHRRAREMVARYEGTSG